MRNPFEELGPATKNYEEVEGAFSCQDDTCHETVTEAKYLREQNVLTWKCSLEHISYIKGFVL